MIYIDVGQVGRTCVQCITRLDCIALEASPHYATDIDYTVSFGN
jgi:hypothetical protein